MHEVLVNRLGGLSLPKKNVVRLTGRPDMTIDVYRGRKTTTQQNSGERGAEDFINDSILKYVMTRIHFLTHWTRISLSTGV